eukprot:COSAG06_NODE_1948_length_8000_cov_8.928870_3_plen_281_part_00
MQSHPPTEAPARETEAHHGGCDGHGGSSEPANSCGAGVRASQVLRVPIEAAKNLDVRSSGVCVLRGCDADQLRYASREQGVAKRKRAEDADSESTRRDTKRGGSAGPGRSGKKAANSAASRGDDVDEEEKKEKEEEEEDVDEVDDANDSSENEGQDDGDNDQDDDEEDDNDEDDGVKEQEKAGGDDNDDEEDDDGGEEQQGVRWRPNFASPNAVSTVAAGECPMCVKGSGKPVGHKGRHMNAKVKPKAAGSSSSSGECPLCAPGSGKPVGHKGRHLVKIK